MKKLFARFAKDESGATAIEYGLIAGLVSVVIVTILTTMGDSLIDVFTRVDNALQAAAGGGS
ncbi:pilus assembly protein [Pannonibacter phragmitetus]|uniref:Flp family type IVb pilin n=1 Tax=Pannonibacter TaxID=227873 RepID=UPI00067AEB37|nr:MULTISPECIES: Flp family type IVb pilin [Pannonibacter]KND20215.1 pilus assembly protein [Pannonibacter phragmitetus]